MKKILLVTAFMLATLAWAVAQQPGAAPEQGQQSGQQAAPPSSQEPNTGQQQAPPAGAEQSAPQPGAQASEPGQAASAPITEGCLGGSNPNFTITDTAGKTYKLKLPANADASSLAPHVGESVQVMGDVNTSSNSISVSRIGRGTGKCPASGSSAPQAPPK